MKFDVNDKDDTNPSNSRSNYREGDIPGKNEDIKTSDIDEGGETASQIFQVKQTSKQD